MSIYCQGTYQDRVFPVASETEPLKAISNINNWQDALISIGYHKFKGDKVDDVLIPSGSCPNYICINLLLCVADMSLMDDEEESSTTIDLTNSMRGYQVPEKETRISIFLLVGPTSRRMQQQCDQDGHVKLNYFVQDHQDTKNVLSMILTVSQVIFFCAIQHASRSPQ
jgi:hypothetical protein